MTPEEIEYRANLKEKMKIVEQIGRMKRQKFNSNQYEDEGIDVDTFEANYVPEYEDEDRPRDRFEGGYGTRGGRGGRGGARGGRGGNRGGRGNNRGGRGGRDGQGPR